VYFIPKVSDPLTPVVKYTMKIARFLFIKRQDCSLFNVVVPDRMFKQRSKYRRSVDIAIRR
jgi:hypothetical protein